jgi:hypothetical protein
MTIVRRRFLLLAIPPLVLLCLGIPKRFGFAAIESRGHYAAQTQVLCRATLVRCVDICQQGAASSAALASAWYCQQAALRNTNSRQRGSRQLSYVEWSTTVAGPKPAGERG